MMLTKMKDILAVFLASQLEFENDEIFRLLELPKDSSHGDLAFPCFAMSKILRKSPGVVATEISEKIKPLLPQEFSNCQALGGYLNFFYSQKYWQDLVISVVETQKNKLGENLKIGQGKKAIFDYASPNVAKPMSIGHLRSAVIGQSLVNIFRAMGYETLGINYLGDWGVQFGKLAWAHLNQNLLNEIARKNESKIIGDGFKESLWKKLISDINSKSKDSFDYLYALYVVFHACAEIDDSLDALGREYFLKLEKKTDPKVEAIWKDFITVSLGEYNRVYQLLNVKHDMLRGESFHEPQMGAVINKLKKKGLLKISEGAQIVDLEKFAMAPCLIQKSDGATLYATRDIAAAINRHDDLKGDKLIYVVGAEQTLHFKQFFKVLELMGYEWAKDCTHVPFGLYRFKDGKMSTRRGNVIFLEDVLDKAIELVKEIIAAKNPELKDAESAAKTVGTGAVIFNDLMNDRQKNIDFDWDKVLDFNGDTGPYVQYTHARCCSLLAKWDKELPPLKVNELHESLEKDLLRLLGRFEDALRLAYEQLKPNWIAHYLLELCKAFNGFYYEHRILEGEIRLQEARILLVDCTRITIKRGLELLGIQAPSAM